MKITSVVKQKKNQDRYNVYVDNEFSFSCCEEDIIKYSIYEGLSLKSLDILEELKLNCEITKAYDYALYLVGLRNYTRKEIERRLKNKCYSMTTILAVVEKLEHYSLINDKEYVEKYIKDSMYYKKYGHKKILFNLQSKGIDKNLLESISIDEEEMIKNAIELAQKKLKSLQGKKDIKLRLSRYLQSKGYSYEIIDKAIREIYSTNYE